MLSMIKDWDFEKIDFNYLFILEFIWNLFLKCKKKEN